MNGNTSEKTNYLIDTNILKVPFFEKIFGTKILTDGDVQKRSEEFFDKKTINKIDEK